MAYDKVVDSAALDGALTGIANAIRGKTGGTEKLTLEGMAAAIAGIQVGGGSSGSAFEVTEGTITPTSNTQTIRIPWHKETLPFFYVVMRQDFETYATPDNPATGPVLGGIVQFASGYTRVSGSSTSKYFGFKITSTTSYTGYTGGITDVGQELLTADGLLAYSNSSIYRWQPDVTYKYYIFDKVVQ